MPEETAGKDRAEKPDWKFKIETDKDSDKPISIEANKANTATDFFYKKGQMPDLWIKEEGGGGQTIIPYVIIDGELYVGALREFKRLAGKYLTKAVTGFKSKDLTHDDSAKREFEEESGSRESLSSRIYRFKGRPVNPNSTFFQANPSKGEGSLFYGLRFQPEEVVKRRDSKDSRRRVFVLRPNLRDEVREISEKIKPEGLRFFHIDLLQNTSDGFTLTGLARLQSDLRSRK